MQQDKYIFHLYVFSTCFGRDIAHHQELQNCTNSDMVMVGLIRELLPYLNLYSSVTPDDG